MQVNARSETDTETPPQQKQKETRLDPNRKNFIYRYSTWDDAEAYLALGYTMRPEILLDTIHGQTAVVMEWEPTDCPPPDLPSSSLDSPPQAPLKSSCPTVEKLRRSA